MGLAWWTCTQCKTRWKRHFLSEATSTSTPQDNDLVQFGQHQGRTYQEIHEEFPQYATWVVMTSEQDVEASPGLLHLATYLKTVQADLHPIPEENWEASSDEMMYPQEWVEEDEESLL